MSAPIYAQKTKVPVEASRNEIERTLMRYGAKRHAWLQEPQRAVLMFEASNRRIRFELPLPAGPSDREQAQRRQRWRALLLCIKAKLECVATGIETFEEAFMAHIVMPDDQTVWQHARPAIEDAYKSGTMRPLLPGPGDAKKLSGPKS